jgi:hypothetical protein
MIYIVKNLVQKPEDTLPYWATTKVFAVDDEMALAVSRATCSMEGYRTTMQEIKEKRD